MLGIKTYNNVKIDLWCGRGEDFVSDFTTSDLDLELREIEAPGLRHLALSPDPTSYAAGEFFSELLDKLKDKKYTASKRITIILDNVDLYYSFQKEFFRVFNDV